MDSIIGGTTCDMDTPRKFVINWTILMIIMRKSKVEYSVEVIFTLLKLSEIGNSTLNLLSL